MFRLWAKEFKDYRMLRDTTICDESEDTRTHEVFHALDEVCYEFDLSKVDCSSWGIKSDSYHSAVKDLIE